VAALALRSLALALALALFGQRVRAVKFGGFALDARLRRGELASHGGVGPGAVPISYT
jgi:hypothetical protein